MLIGLGCEKSKRTQYASLCVLYWGLIRESLFKGQAISWVVGNLREAWGEKWYALTLCSFDDWYDCVLV
jgi:hypothetical protein